MATNTNDPWAICDVDTSAKSNKLIECNVYNTVSGKQPFSLWDLYNSTVSISDMVGKEFLAILVEDNDQIVFIGTDCIYIMAHMQDCCESVDIDDICGDLQDLINAPIKIAEELHSDKILGAKSEYDESFTWTFYKLVTLKGYVDIKWYGTSNGYYSERVDLFKVNEEEYPEIRTYYIKKLQDLQIP